MRNIEQSRKDSISANRSPSRRVTRFPSDPITDMVRACSSTCTDAAPQMHVLPLQHTERGSMHETIDKRRKAQQSDGSIMSGVVPSSRNHCRMTGHTTSCCEYTFGCPHPTHVFWGRFVTHQNAVVARSELGLCETD